MINKKEMIITLVMIILIVILLILPTGFAKQIYVNSQGVRAKVLEVDNSAIYSNGIVFGLYQR